MSTSKMMVRVYDIEIVGHLSDGPLHRERFAWEGSAREWLLANRDAYDLATVRQIRATWDEGKSWYDGGGAGAFFRVAPIIS